MQLQFREYGSEGTSLLILHGLFGQSDNWNTLSKQFAAENFRVIVPDQRNHGLSPHSEKWTYEAMASDLKELIGQLELEKPVLLGHSMGGKTVMFFEKFFPGIAEKLVIADMGAREYPDHHRAVIAGLKSVDFEKVKSRQMAEAALSQHITDFGTKQFLLKNIYWKSPGEMDWRFNLDVISREYDNIRTAVPMFHSSVPTLVVRGENSDYVAESDIEDFKKRFSNLQVETIQGAGHWVHAEKPSAFFEAVLNFIKA